jgi:hypothetical protein
MIMERLLSKHGKVASEMIESYQPSEEIRESFGVGREELAKRVFGTLYDTLVPKSE